MLMNDSSIELLVQREQPEHAHAMHPSHMAHSHSLCIDTAVAWAAGQHQTAKNTTHLSLDMCCFLFSSNKTETLQVFEVGAKIALL